jgi:phosphate transport system permease protein
MAVAPTTKPAPAPAGLFGIPNLGDHVFKGICVTAAATVVVLFAAIFAVLVYRSWTAITANGLTFFTSAEWDPSFGSTTFGSLAFVYGTVVTSAIAMLIAVPLGVGTATFLSEIASVPVRKTAAFMVEMLAAIPSVVYGFWGRLVLAPLLAPYIVEMGGETTGGLSILTASLILAVMILPYVTAVSYDVCTAVPKSQREASLALGATRWQMMWTAVLPYARPGILGACFLALGRALGETMAVTMLIGSVPRIDWTPLVPGESIASVVANNIGEASNELYRSSLTELALVLLLVTVVVNTVARLLIWRVSRGVVVRPIASLPAWRRPLAYLAQGVGLVLPNLMVALGVGYLLHFVLALVFKTPRFLPLGGLYDHVMPEVINVPVLVVFVVAALYLAGLVLQWRAGDPTTRAKAVNKIMIAVLASCVVATVGPLVVILTYLLVEGVTSLNLAFFIELPVPDSPTRPADPGGMMNALLGSTILVGLASILAIPVGILAAIYLSEYKAWWFSSAVRFVGELLVGVPSIAIGLVGYFLLVRPMHGNSGWAGALVLAVMMVPIVMRASEESLKLVPTAVRTASYALGATKWQTVCRVVVPAALPAIITGVFLSIARIGGETAPLLLTAGGINQYLRTDPGDPMPSVPVFIYYYATTALPYKHEQAWAAALVLLACIMGLNFGIRFLTGKRVVLASRAD